jgi:ribose-phosphate pyrophosphokinase
MIIVGCSRSKDLAKKISEKLKVEYSELIVKKFPDKELYIRINAEVKNKDVVFIQSLYHPNEAILEAIFAAETAKDLGAKSVVLVAPYLAYMRQDKRFNPGEAISSKILGKLFNIFNLISNFH